MIDESKALKVRRFIETYCVLNTPPFVGETMRLLDWQWTDIIKPLYSTVDETGKRLYKRMVCISNKKVGKTALEAALSIYHMVAAKGINVGIFASNAEQAAILLNVAADMIELAHWVKRSGKTNRGFGYAVTSTR